MGNPETQANQSVTIPLEEYKALVAFKAEAGILLFAANKVIETCAKNDRMLHAVKEWMSEEHYHREEFLKWAKAHCKDDEPDNGCAVSVEDQERKEA